MKGMKKIYMVAGGMILMAGAIEAKNPTLSATMMSRLDSNKDDRVSEKEYTDFGTAYLKKRGKRADPVKMQEKFTEFDCNGDGFITTEDPTYKNPLEEKVMGTWSCENRKVGSISFVFMKDGQADIIQNGQSMRKQTGEALTYRFARPGKTPPFLDIVVTKDGGSGVHFECFIQFTSKNQIKLRRVAGSALASLLNGFSAEGSLDTILLDRGKPIHEEPPQQTVFGSSHRSR